MSYRFHAAAPPGEWLNDPNGLMYADGHYRLFAQHSVAGPSGSDVGWGALSSDDLLDWRWDGVAIAPVGNESAYSGCVLANEVVFTRHDPTRQWQRQVMANLADGVELPISGPEGRNCRDPFVVGERMLLARPCDWFAWRDDAPSTIEIWKGGGADWRLSGTIGPWHPPGMMWEMPAVIDLGAVQALIVSLVDRRENEARCEVRYWLGRLDDSGFARAGDFPVAGVRLDFGPDFYAAIPNLTTRWPDAKRVIVAWASNWARARGRVLANGARGGPITLPREVTLAGNRLAVAPIAAALPLAARTGKFEAALDFGPIQLRADRDAATVRVNDLSEPLTWRGATSRFTGFHDGDLWELFVAPEGISVTMLA